MADRIVTSEDDFSHSKRIPLSVLEKKLERDTRLIKKALDILSVEDPESTHTEAGAISALLNHWLVNRELGYYINGQHGDDFTALTVIPVNGDYGRGLAAMDSWITIDKEELVGLLRSRNINVPDNLANAKTDRTPNINWDYWLALDLWPLDAACKLISGDNPNEPTRSEDIENPDINNRPTWVNLYHHAVSAMKVGNLSEVNGEMTPSAFIAWAAQKGCSVPPEVVAMADQQVAKTADRAGSEKRTAPAASKKARTVEDEGDNVFKNMDRLTWNDILITFIEPESVRIKARGKSETFTYDAMGFKNRNLVNAKPNKVWDTLRTLAIVTNTDKTLTDALPPQTDFKRRVSRLRDALKHFFGIKDNPISYVGTAYKPVFTLTAEEDVHQGRP